MYLQSTRSASPAEAGVGSALVRAIRGEGAVTPSGQVMRVLVLACAVTFTETAFFSALSPLLPWFADRYDLSKAAAGALAASYAVGAMVAALPSILVAKRLGLRTTVVGAMLVISVASIAFGLAGEAWIAYAARFAQGVGSAMAWTAALAWLTTTAPREGRGQAIGFAIGAAFAGALLGPALGATAESIGLLPVFVTVGAFAALVAGWAGLMPDPPPPRDDRPAATAPAFVLVLSIWVIMLAGGLIGVVGVLAPLRLDQLGWTALGVGAVFITASALQTVVNPVLGRLADRLGRTALLRVGLAVSAGACVLLVVDAGKWVYALLVLGAGVCFGTLWTPGMAFLSDTVDRRGLDQVVGFGLMNVAWAPGFALGAAAGGALAGATSDALPYSLAAAVCVLTLIGLGRAVPASRSDVSSARDPSTPAMRSADPPPTAR